MNRAERRKAMAGKVSIATALSKERHEAMKYAVNCYSIAVAYTLYDKMEMPREDIVKAMQAIQELFECIEKDYVDFVDLKKALEDEIGLVIKSE